MAVPTHSSDLAAPVVSPPLPAAIPAGPIPLPVDRFTLPPIKTTDDYLAAWDLIMYWLRRPGFSTAGSDGALVTDSRVRKKLGLTSNLTLELDTFCLTVTLLTFDFEKKC